MSLSVIDEAIRKVELGGAGLIWPRNRCELGEITWRRGEIDGDLVRNRENEDAEDEEEHITEEIRAFRRFVNGDGSSEEPRMLSLCY